MILSKVSKTVVVLGSGYESSLSAYIIIDKNLII